MLEILAFCFIALASTASVILQAISMCKVPPTVGGEAFRVLEQMNSTLLAAVLSKNDVGMTMNLARRLAPPGTPAKLPTPVGEETPPMPLDGVEIQYG